MRNDFTFFFVLKECWVQGKCVWALSSWRRKALDLYDVRSDHQASLASCDIVPQGNQGVSFCILIWFHDVSILSFYRTAM